MPPTPPVLDPPRLGRAVALAVLTAAATAGPTVSAQPDPAFTPASATAPAMTRLPDEAPDKSYLLPALEIIGFDLLLSNYNRRFSGSSDYDVSGSSIRRNLRGRWVTDNDPFKINQFAHPYQGSLYHGAARATGLSYWEASAYTFAGSLWWEITGEQTPPAINDQIASGIAGSFLGEPLFRMAHLLLKSRSSLSPLWREWGAAAISPAVGFNRLAFGSRFDGAFEDHDPIYYGRLRVGGNHATRRDIGSSSGLERDVGEIDFALDYGLPGQPRYTYERPFDYFSFGVKLSSAHGVEILSTRGLLLGKSYAVGDSVRGIWGLYGNYDYLAPQIFRVSTTALSLGTTAQWWISRDVALQGTGLAGIGYSGASTARGVANDRDYHYGTAPRVGLDLRLVAGSRVSVDVAAQRYYLGRIANRNAGRDDISHSEAALTWRVHGRHAIGIKYDWAHRNASYPVLGERQQTLGTVGIYYTLLGMDHFGTVDWRGGN